LIYFSTIAVKEHREMSTTILRPAPAGTFKLDPVHSSVGFAIKRNVVATFGGQFEQVDASLENGVLTGTAYVESVKTVVPQLKEHLLSPEFFNAAETPTITFRSTEMRLGEDGSAEVDGELTIRGTTRPVTARGTYGVATGLRGSQVVGFDLEATVDRREYGLNWQAPLPTGGDALGWDVTLEVRLELEEE
jgi:polyisoprenoid-binding protein YceI